MNKFIMVCWLHFFICLSCTYLFNNRARNIQRPLMVIGSKNQTIKGFLILLGCASFPNIIFSNDKNLMLHVVNTTKYSYNVFFFVNNSFYWVFEKWWKKMSERRKHMLKHFCITFVKQVCYYIVAYGIWCIVYISS